MTHYFSPARAMAGTSSILDDPEAWKRLEYEARARNDAIHGLKLALATSDALFPAWSDAANLRHALRQLAEDTAAMRPWDRLDLAREEDVWFLRRRFLNSNALLRRQEAELGMAALLRHLRSLLGADWQPVEVHFQHPRPMDIAPHQRVFGPALQFAQPHDAILLSDGTVRRTLRARPSADAAAVRTISPIWPAPGLSDRVRSEIRSQLATGEPRLETVAEAVGLSPWTLQRRLARSGEVFSQMVEDMRKNLALALLAQDHLPVSEIALMVGYSEVSAFSRVCRRWFGQPPSGLRKSCANTQEGMQA